MNIIYKQAFETIIDSKYTSDEIISVLKICIDNDINLNNSYIMHKAIGKGDIKIINFLIENGIDLNSDMLMKAVHTNGLELIKFLLDYGIDPNSNINVLINACSKSETAILELLLKYGLDVCIQDNKIIKHYSERHGRDMWMGLNIIQLLVNHGVDPFSHDRALLRIACKPEDWDYDLAKFLIQCDPSKCELDEKMMKDLFNMPGGSKIKKLFLDKGLNPTISQKNDLNPLEYAICQRDLEICKLLLEYGADILQCENILNSNYEPYMKKYKKWKYCDKANTNDIIALFPNYDITNFMKKLI